jgi:hypothetical protein
MQQTYNRPKPVYMDPHRPVLLNSQALEVSIEQKEYIRYILSLSSSDSRFAQKAADALIYVLTNGPTPVPHINSINPTTAALGDENFELTVSGEKFDEGAQIVWNGSVEPTTSNGQNELKTMVNMDTAEVAADIPVQVQNPNGTISNIETFKLTDPTVSQTEQQKKDFNPNPNVNIPPQTNPLPKPTVPYPTPLPQTERNIKSNLAPPLPPDVPSKINPNEGSVSPPKK